jgi:hypothetical protein
VEILLAPAAAEDFEALAEHAWEWLGADRAQVAEVMGKIVAEIPEIERLFETALLQPEAASLIVEQARDLLILRNLQAQAQARGHGQGPGQSQEQTQGRLRAPNLKPEAPTASPPDEGRCDPLTGLFNRGYLDLMLRREFQAAMIGEWPLSVVFVDLDRFEGIHQAHGKEAGESVLVSTAKSIASVARDTDCVGRYGDARGGRRRDLLQAIERPIARQRTFDWRQGSDRDGLSGARDPRAGKTVSARFGPDQRGGGFGMLRDERGGPSAAAAQIGRSGVWGQGVISRRIFGGRTLCSPSGMARSLRIDPQIGDYKSRGIRHEKNTISSSIGLFGCSGLLRVGCRVVGGCCEPHCGFVGAEHCEVDV